MQNTPAVSISYDRLGRQTSQSNGLATTGFEYDPANLALDTETVAIDPDGSGPLPGLTRILDRSRDLLNRDSGFELKTESLNTENSVSYGYDASGRMSTVTSPAGSFTYAYTPGSSLIASVTGPVHIVANTWEPNRDVLDVKDNRIPSTSIPISRFDFIVNGINQRTQVQTTGSAFPSEPADWAWGYDALGQVTSADSPTAGFDRAYEYDLIGNRKRSADGALVTTGEATVYEPNPLNQYSSIPRPLPLGEGGGEGATVQPAYDPDGNATSYPLPVAPTANATLAYDGENRLVSVTTSTTTVSYTYDGQSRRVARLQGSNVTLYLYDAWNCIAEYTLQNSSFNLHTLYSWGLDLSGSLQGAGGVGGLLAATKHQAQNATHYFPTFDGNGNISEYLTTSGSIATHFEYDPFGRTIVATGPNAADFNYRFSTKPVDVATGIYYYGLRFYDTVAGRWTNRDPIEETGGVNLYGFVENVGVNGFDLLGMKWNEVPGTARTYGSWMHQTTRLNIIDYGSPQSFAIQLETNQVRLRYSANGKACCENSTTGKRKWIEDFRYKLVDAPLGEVLPVILEIEVGKPKDMAWDAILAVGNAATKGHMVAAGVALATAIRVRTPEVGDPGDGWDDTLPSPQGHGCARLDIIYP